MFHLYVYLQVPFQQDFALRLSYVKNCRSSQQEVFFIEDVMKAIITEVAIIKVLQKKVFLKRDSNTGVFL